MTRHASGALVRFFLITYAVSWSFFIPVAATVGSSITPFHYGLIFLGTIAPSFVALGLTARAEGDRGVRALVDRAFRWRVPARWYVFAIGYTASIKLAAAIVHRLLIGSWPHPGPDPLVVIPFAILISTPVQAGEEIGWRGYALPRLAARFGLGGASVLLGTIWAFWHLPLFFVRGADTYGQSFVFYWMQVTALSITFAWLYARTGGSLLLVMLLHAAVNNSKDIFPSTSPALSHPFGLNVSPMGRITLGFLWLAATYFLIRMPRWEAVMGGPSTTPSSSDVRVRLPERR